MEFLFDEGLKLLAAVVLGGAVGLERELVGKPAGLRTNVLIAIGSTLITLTSVRLAGPTGDPARVAAQIVTGVGFIGAGTILQARGAVIGLTTAATIWAVAGIGIAIGAGAIDLAVGATVVILVCLTALRRIERWNIGRRALVTFEIMVTEKSVCAALLDVFSSHAFTLEYSSVRKTDAGVELSVAGTTGRQTVHALLAALGTHDDVVSVNVRC